MSPSELVASLRAADLWIRVGSDGRHTLDAAPIEAAGLIECWAASGIETRSAKTEGLGPKDESPPGRPNSPETLEE